MTVTDPTPTRTEPTGFDKALTLIAAVLIGAAIGVVIGNLW